MDPFDRKRLFAFDDKSLLACLTRFDIPHRNVLRGHGDRRPNPSRYRNRKLPVLLVRIVGQDHHLVDDLRSHLGVLQAHMHPVSDTLGLVHGRIEPDFKGLSIASNVDDLKSLATHERQTQIDRLFLPDLDITKLDLPRLDRNIRSDRSAYSQLNLGVKWLIEYHRDHCAFGAGKRPGVETRDNLTLLPRLQGRLGRHRCGATATAPDTRDVDVFLKAVFKHKSMLGLGIATDTTKIMMRLAKELLGPLLRHNAGIGAQNIEQTEQSDEKTDSAIR